MNGSGLGLYKRTDKKRGGGNLPFLSTGCIPKGAILLVTTCPLHYGLGSVPVEAVTVKGVYNPSSQEAGRTDTRDEREGVTVPVR